MSNRRDCIGARECAPMVNFASSVPTRSCNHAVHRGPGHRPSRRRRLQCRPASGRAKAVRAGVGAPAARADAEPSARRDTVQAKPVFVGPGTHLDQSYGQPENPAALLLAGRIARAVGDFEAALSYLKRAAALGANREVLLETARTLDQAGAGSAAKRAWRAVLQAIPQSHEAMRQGSGGSTGRMAIIDEAASLLERAVVAGGVPGIDLVRSRRRPAGPGRPRRRGRRLPPRR